LAWLIAGKPDEARAQLELAEQSLAPGFHLPHVFAVQAACNIDLYTGDVASASRRLDEAWPNIERIGVLRMQLVRIELEYLRIRTILADRSRSPDDRARQVRPAAEDLIKEGTPWAVGIGLC